MAGGKGRIRFGVIGAAGLIGNSHIKAILANPDLAELVAVSDINETKLQEVAKEHGAKAYTSYKDLCSDPNVDAVTLGTPHPLHPEQALAAIENGKHVLTEKAMAGRLSQARRMVDAAKARGVKLGVCFQHRIAPAHVKAFELMQSGQVGEMLRVVCQNSAYKSEYYYNSGAWRGTWAGEEGGVLVNQAPHPIDIMLKLTGMPKRIWAVCRTQMHDNIEVEDTATAILEYPNGAQGMVHFNTTTVPGVNRCEIYGTKGAIWLDKANLQFFRNEQPADEFSKTYAGPNIYGSPKSEQQEIALPEIPEQGHPGLVANFCRAIQCDETLHCPGEEGLWSLEFANALVMSSYTGQPVDLPLDAAAYDRLMDQLAKTGKGAAHRPLQPSPVK